MVLRFLSLAILVAAAPLLAQDPVPARKRAPLTVLPTKRTQEPAGWLGFRHSAERDSLVVLEVAAGSPAERAGLRTGDIITMVGDRAATRQLLLDNPPMVGDSRRLTVRRGDRTLALEMVAVAPPPGTLMPTRAMAAVADTVATEARLLRSKMARVATRGTIPTTADSQLYVDFKVNGKLSQEYADVLLTLKEMRRDSVQRSAVPTKVDPELYQQLEQTLKGSEEMLVKLKAGASALAGAEFEQLNPGLAEYFGGISEGMFVLRVADGTPAADAGLQPGDIIETLNGERVVTIVELRKGVAATSGPLTLNVIRRGRPATVVLRKQ
jgi:C-terminal processing protease CtpA/Prc